MQRPVFTRPRSDDEPTTYQSAVVSCDQKETDYLVRVDNNTIWLYDHIDDISLFKLKTGLISVNQSLDSLRLQFFENDGGYKPVIHLHINSPGGNVTEALHMYDIIKSSKYPVHTYADGYIASGATLPFLAGTHRTMTDNSVILVHQLRHHEWGWQTYDQQSSAMQRSDVLMELLRKVYLAQLSITSQKLDQLLSKDWYLNADESRKYGFIKQFKAFHKTRYN